MKTTLRKIYDGEPCESGWNTLLEYLGKTEPDDEPLSICTILDSNGIYDALWCLKTVEEHDKEIRLYAVWCARQVDYLMKDQRSIKSLDIAEKFANGKATKEELIAAEKDAWKAASALLRAPQEEIDAVTAAAHTCGNIKTGAAVLAACCVIIAEKVCRTALKYAMKKRLRELCEEETS